MLPSGLKTIKKATSYVFVFCLLVIITLVDNGKLWGHDLTTSQHASEPAVTVDTQSQIEINTTVPGDGITGYGGPVPLIIYISNNTIDSIVPLPNQETPGFFKKLSTSGFDKSWNGKTVEEAMSMDVDAVTGATISSNAFIANVRAGLSQIPDTPDKHITAAPQKNSVDTKQVFLIIILLGGAIIPLFIKNHTYRTIQQLFNVAILGFWGGTFLSYAMIFNFIGNGLSMSISALITVMLLIIGFIYPLFGKHNYYCSWICPFGSLQELAGNCSTKKIKFNRKTIKWLDIFRQAIWIILMLMLLVGWGSKWIDYEIFTMFIVQNASASVIAIGIAFILLSIFIPRPFCRFVCPMGTMLKKL